jgi:hypothetical protein
MIKLSDHAKHLIVKYFEITVLAALIACFIIMALILLAEISTTVDDFLKQFR